MPGKPYQKQSAVQYEASGIGSTQQDDCLLPSALHLVHVPCTKTQSDKLIGHLWDEEVKGISECQSTQLHQKYYKFLSEIGKKVLAFLIYCFP